MAAFNLEQYAEQVATWRGIFHRAGLARSHRRAEHPDTVISALTLTWPDYQPPQEDKGMCKVGTFRVRPHSE